MKPTSVPYGLRYKCIVPLCKNKMSTNRHISYFSIPKSVVLRRKWIKNCKIRDCTKIVCKQRLKVCGEHFETKMFLNNLKNRLIPNAFPTLFTADTTEASIDICSKQLKMNNEPVSLDDQEVDSSVQGNEPCTDALAVGLPDIIPVISPSTPNEFTVDSSSGFDSPCSSRSDHKALTNETPRKNLLREQLKIEKEGRLKAEKAVIYLGNQLAELESAEHFLKLCEKHLSSEVMTIVKSYMLCTTSKPQNSSFVQKKVVEQNKDDTSFVAKTEPAEEQENNCESSCIVQKIIVDQNKDDTSFVAKTEPAEEQEDNDESPCIIKKEFLEQIEDDQSFVAKIEPAVEEENDNSQTQLYFFNGFFPKKKVEDNQSFVAKIEPAVEEENDNSQTQCVIKSKIDPKLASSLPVQYGGHSDGLKERLKHKSFKCVICKKSFTNKDILARHIDTGHTIAKPYACKYCEKSFTSEGYLIIHLRQHKGVPSYECAICQETFSQKYQLQSHIIKHTGIKPYRCDYCLKLFSSKRYLNIHHRLHTGTFECNICQKSFSQKHQWITHQKIHSRLKKHRCQFCEKSFTKKENFTQHLRIHTRFKPYECEICKKSFSQKDHLNTHLKNNVREAPYMCSICEKPFQSRCLFKVHISFHI